MEDNLIPSSSTLTTTSTGAIGNPQPAPLETPKSTRRKRRKRVDPLNPLKETIEDQIATNTELKQKVEDGVKNIDKINSLVLFGFLVVVIMFATFGVMVVQILNDSYIAKTQSYNQLLERISDLKFEQDIQGRKIESFKNVHR